MPYINHETKFIPKVLATDLDGTLIPLPDSPENTRDLEKITAAQNANAFRLIFCTGRHFSSVMDAINQYRLPPPDWMICDVGTTIYRNQDGSFHPFELYTRHLQDLTIQTGREDIESLLEGLPGLTLQQENHQGEFKISYECIPENTDALIERISRLLRDFKIPYAATGSIDPFLHCGLIDLLPEGVSKAYALTWLATHAGYKNEQVLYAGDSGNDYPALTAGWPTIVVANASQGLAHRVKKRLKANDQSKHFFQAKKTATSGVLEGCRHFGWID